MTYLTPCAILQFSKCNLDIVARETTPNQFKRKNNEKKKYLEKKTNDRINL